MQGKQKGDDVLKFRYGNNFSWFKGMPTVICIGYGQSGKDTACGLEQRHYEEYELLGGTANKQNPVWREKC